MLPPPSPVRLRHPRTGVCASPVPSSRRHYVVVPVAPVSVPPPDSLSRASPCRSQCVRSLKVISLLCRSASAIVGDKTIAFFSNG
ncbi:hypothetical protein PIB30_099333 [Stylosanthes scabra]|uniref:Uncharacterized protein n=1 Tax=Stylosanthes scabra TaxID=79078 RepID=A0ABU6UXM0_9FABA|nr:hypothetical protein [Stylosanthes scabra]